MLDPPCAPVVRLFEANESGRISRPHRSVEKAPIRFGRSFPDQIGIELKDVDSRKPLRGHT